LRPEIKTKLSNNLSEGVSPAFKHELNKWLAPSEIKEHQESLYLINTRLWIKELRHKYGQSLTIDTIPEKEWSPLLKKYDTFWFMGIYVPSPASQDHAKKYVDQYRYALPNINSNIDIVASPFAIPDYIPNPEIVGNWFKWDKMLEKLHSHGKKVVIDFVPNHTGLDHSWAKTHPEYYIQGSESQYHSSPNFYYPVIDHKGNTHYLAHGKDPNYPEWSDTLQLNIANPIVQEEMGKIMLQLVDHADGIRCDMAMLVNPSTFLRTWGWALTDQQKDFLCHNPFWEKQLKLVKAKADSLGKRFDIAGEIYWDKEELGKIFDGMYDNYLYQQFLEVSSGKNPQKLREHIKYLVKRQNNGQPYRSWLYVENHDEERGLKKFGGLSKTFAVLAGIIPDSVFMVNQGQEKGSRIRPPMQIGRFPKERVDSSVSKFYKTLFDLKNSRLFQQGDWDMATIYTENPNIIALEVRSPDKKICSVVCVNSGNYKAQCSVPEITANKDASVISLTDPSNIKVDAIRQQGLFIELKPGEVQVVFFSVDGKEFKAPISKRRNLFSFN